MAQISVTNRCLVLIDLQNEFLSPGGNFPIHDESRGFLDKLPGLITAFRASGQPVFWIRSEYTNNGVARALGEAERRYETTFLSGTHTGKNPCCGKGSFGAGFPDSIASLIAEPGSSSGSGDVVITKGWYSAFKETSLLTELRQRQITEIYVGGLLSNVCISSTVLDARNLGFDVTLVEDCLGWRKRASNEKAVEKMLRHGAQLVTSTGLDNKRTTASNSLPRLYYVNGSIPSWRTMMALYEKNIDFNPTRLFVMTNPKETRLPGFIALNHRGKTPVFVDAPPLPPTSEAGANSEPEVVTINESLAILHYIETYHNSDRPLLPPLAQCVPRALALARIQESENLRLAYDALEDAHFDAENADNKLSTAERAKLIGAVDKELDYWEVYAAKTTFIAGDEFGLADCAFFPCLAYMVHRGFEWRRLVRANDTGCEFEEVDTWPSLKAYFHRVWDRGGKDGCAQKSQPAGWERKGKANVWKGTIGGSKGRYRKQH